MPVKPLSPAGLNTCLHVSNPPGRHCLVQSLAIFLPASFLLAVLLFPGCLAASIALMPFLRLAAFPPLAFPSRCLEAWLPFSIQAIPSLSNSQIFKLYHLPFPYICISTYTIYELLRIPRLPGLRQPPAAAQRNIPG